MLLASPYHQPLDPHERALGKPYPPLGTLVTAAALRAAGHEVRVYDPMFCRDVDTFALSLAGADRVAILPDPHSVPVKMCTITVRDAAFRMIRLARQAGAEVLVAGPDASDRPEAYAAAGADVVVVGEHDGPVAAWVEGQTLPSIVPRAPLPDLAGLPLPAWELVDLGAYARSWRSRHGLWEMNVSTARGCPYRCNWCAKPTWGRSYRVRPVADVVAEIDALRTGHQPDRLWFTDDIFAVRPGWLAEFRARMDPIPFRCLTRVDLVRDEAYVRDLAASGCVEVWLGAESGSQSVLDAMDKDCTVEEISRASGLLRDHGIRRGFFLQLGYPGESREDVLGTVRMVRALQPDEIGVSVSYPLPGTVFHERVREQMGATNWAAAMDNTLLYRAPYPQAFYDAARELLRSEHAVLSFRAANGPRRALGAAWHALRWPAVRAAVGALA